MMFDRKTKEGQAAYSRHWRAQNKEHYDAWRRQRYAERKEEINALRRARAAEKRQANPRPKRKVMSDAEKAAKSRAYYLANREKILARQVEYRDANRDQIYAKAAAKRKEDPNCHRWHNNRWRKQNLAKCAANRARRRALRINATPPWANKKQMERIYQLAAWGSRFTEERLEVDHIIPLQGDDICGLHVETNLQILPMTPNRSKGNSWKEYIPAAQVW